MRRRLRAYRRQLFSRESFLWLQLSLAEVPRRAGMPEGIRVYTFDERWAFLDALPQELAERLGRLWVALPRSLVFAHAAEGTPVAYYCFASNGLLWIEELGVQRYFAPDEAYVHTCYTLPPYRGRGLHSRTIAAACGWLACHGFRQAYALVGERNLPSLRGFQRAGFASVSRVVTWRLGGYLVRVRSGRGVWWDGS
ncbi:MAG: GNAT family N-acetyltransferase [Chlorobiota bacterium]